jgi:SAM-dependent methyltransferase
LHTTAYHHILLREVPRPCSRALDIGCGLGSFARKLSRLAGHVDAIDRDPAVVELARASASGITNVHFTCVDFMAVMPHERNGYDFVCALASLHHLPLPAALERMESLLKPGGVLAVIGLYRSRGIFDFAWSLAAFPVSLWLRIARPRVRAAVPLRDPSLTLRETRAIAVDLLPGAVLRRRLLWRYTLLWHAT